MVTNPSDTHVVTLRAMQELLRHVESKHQSPSGSASPAAQLPDAMERALLLNRYRHLIERIEQRSRDAGPNVLVAPEDREAARLQSKLAELSAAGVALPAGGLEAKFGTGATGGDVWGWMKSLFDHVDRSEAHPMKRPVSATAAAFPKVGRIAMLGDWGTNLYGAPVSAQSIAHTGPYELLLHLGDVYYSGTKSEVKARFLDAWPTAAAKSSRALNSNHEMYSGGFAYFDDVLPAFGQDASYFALRNEHWLLAGLDTAYVDHDIDASQVAWLETLVRDAGARKLILFSHQQPFSRFDAQGPKLLAALHDLLKAKAIAAWYWGHEHDCILYDSHPEFGFSGRCAGNGGVPSPRREEIMNAPSERVVDAVSWKRFLQTADCPSLLILDGDNPYISGEERRFSPHGYMTLELNGPTITERVHLPDGTEIYAGQIA